MTRVLYEVGSILLLIAALAYAAVGIARGVPGAWVLCAVPAVVYVVITISQRLPITSLNLTAKVTPENELRIDPVVRDFLASIKAFTMMLITWVIAFATSRLQMPFFLFIEAVLLLAIFAQVYDFIAKMKKLA